MPPPLSRILRSARRRFAERGNGAVAEATCCSPSFRPQSLLPRRGRVRIPGSLRPQRVDLPRQQPAPPAGVEEQGGRKQKQQCERENRGSQQGIEELLSV